MEFKRITWQQLEKDCIALAKRINGTKDKIDEIISISRGGLVVSRILSDLLDLKISNISIESYQPVRLRSGLKNIMQQKKPVITQYLPETYKNETVLLVDEVSDTGKTFKHALLYLKTLPIRKIYTTAPYIKPHTTFIPDFWVVNMDGWFIYPYEIRETKEALLSMYARDEVEKKLKELGIESWEL